MGDLTNNFSAYEFACPCCGQSRMDLNTVDRLQALRDAYGERLDIIEGGGYRCSKYDGKQGAHTEGHAADLGFPREDLFKLVALATAVGFTGIGVKNKDGAYQLHVDDAPARLPSRPRPWLWTY